MLCLQYPTIGVTNVDIGLVIAIVVIIIIPKISTCPLLQWTICEIVVLCLRCRIFLAHMVDNSSPGDLISHHHLMDGKEVEVGIIEGTLVVVLNPLDET